MDKQKVRPPIVSKLYVFCDDVNDWWVLKLLLSIKKPDRVGDEVFVYVPVIVSEDEEWINFVLETENDSDLFLVYDQEYEAKSFATEMASYYFNYTKRKRINLTLLNIGSLNYKEGYLSCLCFINEV